MEINLLNILQSNQLAFLPGVGPLEIILVFIIALIIFGPKKLPEVGKALGESISQFKKASRKISEEDTSQDSQQ